MTDENLAEIVHDIAAIEPGATVEQSSSDSMPADEPALRLSP
jgi:hypothetical protein